MDEAKVAFEQAREMDAAGERAGAYFKWLDGAFSAWTAIATNAVYPECRQRLSPAKTERLFRILADALIRAEHCLSAVIQTTPEEAEELASMTCLGAVGDAHRIFSTDRRLSLRAPSKAADSSSSLMIPASRLTLCLAEVLLGLQLQCQAVDSLWMESAAKKASAQWVFSLKQALALVRQSLRDRVGIEATIRASESAVNLEGPSDAQLDSLASIIARLDGALLAVSTEAFLRKDDRVDENTLPLANFGRFLTEALVAMLNCVSVGERQALTTATLIKLAQALVDRHGDYSGASAIVAAISQTKSEEALKNAGATLLPSVITLNGLLTLFSAKLNYSALRIAHRQMACAVPTVSLLLYDWRALNQSGCSPECQANSIETIEAFKRCAASHKDELEENVDIGTLQIEHWLLSLYHQ